MIRLKAKRFKGGHPMRRSCAVILALVLSGTVSLYADDKSESLPTTISWHGQSFFTIKTSKGTRIAIDPHSIPQYGRIIGLKADIVLVSHNHDDHTQIGVIENIKDPGVRIITGLKGASLKADWNPIDLTIKDVHIRSVGVYHDNMEGLKYGKNTAFILEVDGWKICHLGDLGHLLTPAQLKKIGPVDVLMIPVGGVYSINGQEAREVVAQIKPKEYIFPMHCGTRVYDDLLPAAEFLEDQDRTKVTSSHDNRLILNRDPQRPRPLIVQLNFWPKGKRD
jgi:L-ascorbate metabolism protein UlaG (beta-lactamase superfamily)